MTWLPANSMKELLDNLKLANVLKTQRVYDTMHAFDRKVFCELSPRPYSDSPQSLGYGATISAPHMHAYALEYLQDKLTPGARVLDVGSGSGILTAYMALMVCPGGLAVGVDHIPELVESANKNVMAAKPELFKNEAIKFMVADARTHQFEDGPFDAIHVGASCDEEPKHLIALLKPGGIMVAPVGKIEQKFTSYEKDKNGEVHKKELLGVIYVPLTEKDKQLGKYK